MRCIGRVLNPSRPVGPTTCKAIPGLALSLDSWNRSSVRPCARPVGTAYLQGRPSEASGTSSESLTTRKREGCKPAADRPASAKGGTLDSKRLARFSPFVAEVALELTTLKKPWSLEHVRCIGRFLNPSRPVGPTTCKAILGLALSLGS